MRARARTHARALTHTRRNSLCEIVKEICINNTKLHDGAALQVTPFAASLRGGVTVWPHLKPCGDSTRNVTHRKIVLGAINRDVAQRQRALSHTISHWMLQYAEHNAAAVPDVNRGHVVASIANEWNTRLERKPRSSKHELKETLAFTVHCSRRDDRRSQAREAALLRHCILKSVVRAKQRVRRSKKKLVCRQGQAETPLEATHNKRKIGVGVVHEQRP